MKMKCPRLIVITGIDGSGKTIIANLLVKHLRSKGCKTKYVWIKSLHTLAYLISRIFKSQGWHRLVKNPNKIVVSRFELPRSKSAEKIWPTIEFISVLPWIILRVNLAIFLVLRLSQTYIIDTIVPIAMRTRNSSFVGSFLGKLLLRMIPKEAIIIYLDVDLHTLSKRRPNIEYTTDEILSQIALYRLLAEKMRAYVIDTAILGIKDMKTKVVNFVSNSSKIGARKKLHAHARMLQYKPAEGEAH